MSLFRKMSENEHVLLKGYLYVYCECCFRSCHVSLLSLNLIGENWALISATGYQGSDHPQAPNLSRRERLLPGQGACQRQITRTSLRTLPPNRHKEISHGPLTMAYGRRVRSQYLFAPWMLRLVTVSFKRSCSRMSIWPQLRFAPMDSFASGHSIVLSFRAYGFRCRVPPQFRLAPIDAAEYYLAPFIDVASDHSSIARLDVRVSFRAYGCRCRVWPQFRFVPFIDGASDNSFVSRLWMLQSIMFGALHGCSV